MSLPEEEQNRSLIIQLLSKLDKLEERLGKLEKQVPETFDIFYKPPGKDKHEKLNETLDNLHVNLNTLEEAIRQQE
jgi:hypothetical protein